MNGEMLLVSFFVATGIATAVASIQRCYRDASPRHFLKKFEEWKLGDEGDAGERVLRIGVFFDLVMLLLRAFWFGLWFVYRSEARPWYWRGGEWTLVSWDGLAGTALEIVLMSFLFLVLLPALASAFHGTQISLATLPIVVRLEALLKPLTSGYRGLVRGLSKLAGRGEERSGADLAEEGIRAAVEIGELQGVLHDREKTMMESLLEFRDAEVTQVMTPRTEMVCLESSLSVRDAIPIVIECGHSRIPVYRENLDSIIGVLYVKDLLRYDTGESARATPIERIVRKVYFVPESKKISELLAEFRANRFHIAVILDEYGGTSGLVTIEDIIEEIVGEIEDEYDYGSHSLIHRVNDGVYDIDARAHISDVNEAIGCALPDSDDYDTIAGLILAVTGRVPKEGETIEYQNLGFRIVSGDERKLRRLRVQLLHPEAPSEK